ncbi:MAG: DUF3568 family protein [Dechloromonas sp.]|nr:MAG: DUF3568 family protein [Dechloromonas sp.]
MLVVEFLSLVASIQCGRNWPVRAGALCTMSPRFVTLCSMAARRFSTLFAIMLFAFAACGCAAVALTAAAVGGGIAANHQLGGIAYRTFTAPLPRVRSAAMTALKRMGIKPDGSEKIDYGERLLAKAGDRNIEIELEALTANTTRMRVVAKKDGGVIVDSSTAVEIITQTEKSIGTL